MVILKSYASKFSESTDTKECFFEAVDERVYGCRTLTKGRVYRSVTTRYLPASSDAESQYNVTIRILSGENGGHYLFLRYLFDTSKALEIARGEVAYFAAYKDQLIEPFDDWTVMKCFDKLTVDSHDNSRFTIYRKSNLGDAVVAQRLDKDDKGKENYQYIYMKHGESAVSVEGNVLCGITQSDKDCFAFECLPWRNDKILQFSYAGYGAEYINFDNAYYKDDYTKSQPLGLMIRRVDGLILYSKTFGKSGGPEKESMGVVPVMLNRVNRIPSPGLLYLGPIGYETKSAGIITVEPVNRVYQFKQLKATLEYYDPVNNMLLAIDGEKLIHMSCTTAIEFGVNIVSCEPNQEVQYLGTSAVLSKHVITLLDHIYLVHSFKDRILVFKAGLETLEAISFPISLKGDFTTIVRPCLTAFDILLIDSEAMTVLTVNSFKSPIVVRKSGDIIFKSLGKSLFVDSELIKSSVAMNYRQVNLLFRESQTVRLFVLAIEFTSLVSLMEYKATRSYIPSKSFKSAEMLAMCSFEAATVFVTRTGIMLLENPFKGLMLTQPTPFTEGKNSKDITEALCLENDVLVGSAEKYYKLRMSAPVINRYDYSEQKSLEKDRRLKDYTLVVGDETKGYYFDQGSKKAMVANLLEPVRLITSRIAKEEGYNSTQGISFMNWITVGFSKKDCLVETKVVDNNEPKVEMKKLNNYKAQVPSNESRLPLSDLIVIKNLPWNVRLTPGKQEKVRLERWIDGGSEVAFNDMKAKNTVLKAFDSNKDFAVGSVVYDEESQLALIDLASNQAERITMADQFCKTVKMMRDSGKSFYAMCTDEFGTIKMTIWLENGSQLRSGLLAVRDLNPKGRFGLFQVSATRLVALTHDPETRRGEVWKIQIELSDKDPKKMYLELKETSPFKMPKSDEYKVDRCEFVQNSSASEVGFICASSPNRRFEYQTVGLDKDDKLSFGNLVSLDFAEQLLIEDFVCPIFQGSRLTCVYWTHQGQVFSNVLQKETGFITISREQLPSYKDMRVQRVVASEAVVLLSFSRPINQDGRDEIDNQGLWVYIPNSPISRSVFVINQQSHPELFTRGSIDTIQFASAGNSRVLIGKQFQNPFAFRIQELSLISQGADQQVFESISLQIVDGSNNVLSNTPLSDLFELSPAQDSREVVEDIPNTGVEFSYRSSGTRDLLLYFLLP